MTSWNNPGAPVTVSVPYTPTAEEQADSEHIVVWYIEGSGNISVPTGRYNVEAVQLHYHNTLQQICSKLCEKTFEDLKGVEWAAKYEVLASKGYSRYITDNILPKRQHHESRFPLHTCKEHLDWMQVYIQL